MVHGDPSELNFCSRQVEAKQSFKTFRTRCRNNEETLRDPLWMCSSGRLPKSERLPGPRADPCREALLDGHEVVAFPSPALERSTGVGVFETSAEEFRG